MAAAGGRKSAASRSVAATDGGRMAGRPGWEGGRVGTVSRGDEESEEGMEGVGGLGGRKDGKEGEGECEPVVGGVISGMVINNTIRGMVLYITVTD